MKDLLKFLLGGSEVTRYHTVRTLTRETVGHHSHGVAMICMFLQRHPSAALLRAALLHDMAEQHLGDIPSPAKREYGIGEQVNELEKKLLESVGMPIENLFDSDYRILKLADIAQGALFCVREMQLGNSGMKVVFDRYISYAEAFVLVGKERELFDAIKQMQEELK